MECRFGSARRFSCTGTIYIDSLAPKITPVRLTTRHRMADATA
jgi:hypothetical protein